MSFIKPLHPLDTLDITLDAKFDGNNKPLLVKKLIVTVCTMLYNTLLAHCKKCHC